MADVLIKKEAEFLLSSLYALYRKRHIYPSTHPKFTEALPPAVDALEKIFLSSPQVTFILVEAEFIFEGEPLFRNTTLMREFAAVLEKFSVERISFSQGVTPGEISALVDFLSCKPEDLVGEGFEATFRKYGLAHVRMERLAAAPALSDVVSGYEGKGPFLNVLPAAIRNPYGILYEKIKALLSSPLYGHACDLDNIDPQIDSLVNNIDQCTSDFMETLHSGNLIIGEMDHELNVCTLMICFGKWIGLEKSFIKELSMAALLHDIGKTQLPEELQKKPETLLSDEEKKLYRRHPELGAELLISIKNTPKLGVIVSLEHHMGFDKQGFPRPNEDFSPHLASLMVGLVDKYEGLIRLSSGKTGPDDLIEKLKPQRGKEYEPHLFDLFANFLKA